ncbi:MAG: hypothetical protein KC438_02075 [Thermomicrobiales bacterium]|nr:hypothetical protein [Thermomicrobiales bacterium]MCO5222717.1 hypothetical protein [Thermomicrobiales bacterium]
MFKGDNFIGVLMVGLCLIVAGIMIWSIGTGERLTYNGPSWLAWLLGIIVIGGSIFGLVRNYRMRRESGGSGQWPNPSTGERSLLDRIRGKGNDSTS